jgi:hypothetical protein
MSFVINPYVYSTPSGDCSAIVGSTFSSQAGTTNILRYPFYGLYDYSHSMFIINQSEFGTGEKQLESISFDLRGYTSGYTYNNQTIRIGHTSDSEFGPSVQVDLTGLTAYDVKTVKSSFSFTISSSGWATITFDDNFCYNGIDNLLVIWENRDGTWQSGYGYSENWFDNSNYLSWYKYQDDTYPTGFGTRDQSYRPNMEFGY